MDIGIQALVANKLENPVQQLIVDGGLDFGTLKNIFESHFKGVLDGAFTFANIVGTGSGIIQDAIGGGYQITTGTTSSNRSTIDFALKRQFDPQAFTLYCICTFDDDNNETKIGLTDAQDFSSTSSRVAIELQAAGAGGDFLNIISHDGTNGSTKAAKSLAQGGLGTGPFFFKLVGTSGQLELFELQGGVWVSLTTKTNNIPTTKVQPFFGVLTRNGSAAVGAIKYLRIEDNS